MSLRNAKATLRQQIKQKLKSIAPDEKRSQSEIVFKNLMQNEKYLKSQRVSVYLSRDIEIDTEPILLNIFSTKKECFIPKYDSGSTQMDMVKLNSYDEYEKLPLTKWNIKQPNSSDNQPVNVVSPSFLDLIIVPGIAFTKDGHRLGNGRGYYDIYLKKCESLPGKKIPTLALAFKEQIVPFVPTDEHDIIIDEVIFP